ncbi:MAG: MarR family transcriptional regulator [Pseudomonadota bacterium]
MSDVDAPMTDRLRLSEFLPYRLSVLSNAVSGGIAEAYAADVGISMRQWRVMAILGERAGATATDVARRAQMDKVAVSRAVSSLVSLGLVERKTSADDGRNAHLFLSSAGQAVYDRVVPIAHAHEARLIAGLTAAERATLAELLGKLAKSASPDRPLW